MSGKERVQPEILGVRDVARCRTVMHKLLQEEGCVAVDAEGVKLSKTGRLTLLQIARQTGSHTDVYIIDVVDSDNVEDTEPAKRLFEQGKIAEVLQSEKIKKVSIHPINKCIIISNNNSLCCRSPGRQA